VKVGGEWILREEREEARDTFERVGQECEVIERADRGAAAARGPCRGADGIARDAANLVVSLDQLARDDGPYAAGDSSDGKGGHMIAADWFGRI
jgi:hypothetical protein